LSPNLHVGHQLVENTQQEYEDSVENQEFCIFSILCKSLTDIEMSYISEDTMRYVTVHCLTELAQAKLCNKVI
jgi:hydroxylamine reductase (hybrid-cluster protein)